MYLGHDTHIGNMERARDWLQTGPRAWRVLPGCATRKHTQNAHTHQRIMPQKVISTYFEVVLIRDRRCNIRDLTDFFIFYNLKNSCTFEWGTEKYSWARYIDQIGVRSISSSSTTKHFYTRGISNCSFLVILKYILGCFALQLLCQRGTRGESHILHFCAPIIVFNYEN